MEGISDIRIIGLDPKRPPVIQKMPAIDLFFELSHKAPKAWCEDFNRLVTGQKYAIKIDPEAGLFIETWVRKPEEIVKALLGLQASVTKCSEQYIARLAAKARDGAGARTVMAESPEQLQLNTVIASLDFRE